MEQFESTNPTAVQCCGRSKVRERRLWWRLVLLVAGVVIAVWVVGSDLGQW